MRQQYGEPAVVVEPVHVNGAAPDPGVSPELPEAVQGAPVFGVQGVAEQGQGEEGDGGGGGGGLGPDILWDDLVLLLLLLLAADVSLLLLFYKRLALLVPHRVGHPPDEGVMRVDLGGVQSSFQAEQAEGKPKVQHGPGKIIKEYISPFRYLTKTIIWQIYSFNLAIINLPIDYAVISWKMQRT